MNRFIILMLCLCSSPSWGLSDHSLNSISKSVHTDLEQALSELATLRKTIASEKIPLSQQIREREAEILRLLGEL